MVLAKTTLRPAVETNTMVDFRVQTAIPKWNIFFNKKKKCFSVFLNQRFVPSTSLLLNIGSAPMRLEEAFLIDP